MGAVGNDHIIGARVEGQRREDLDANPGQEWQTGVPDDDGYFTITHVASGLLLNAKSKDQLTLEGKILISRVVNVTENSF